MATLFKANPRFLIFLLFIVNVSCNNNQHKKNKSDPVKKIKSDTIPVKKNHLIMVKGDSLQVAIDSGFITIPKKTINNYDSVYSGIYIMKNDSVHKLFSIKINNIVYFTTFENVGVGPYRGFLHAYDVKRKKLLINYSSKSKDNYVYAGGGIFLMDKKYIFGVGWEAHENAEDPFYTLVEVYSNNGSKFRDLGYIKIDSEIEYEDTSMVKLYHKINKYDERRPFRQIKW